VAHACLALILFACVQRPADREVINALEFHGNEHIRAEDLAAKLASRETPKFLGLFRGVVYGYQVLNPYVLAIDLQRIERYYRARGFYDARVVAARVIRDANQGVEISIQIQEGEPILVRDISVRGIEAVAPIVTETTRETLPAQIAVGERFEEHRFRAGQEAVERALTDSGYAHARVERTARVDLPRKLAVVRYDAEPGSVAVFGSLDYGDLQRIPEAPLARAIGISPGDPYSTSTLQSAQRAALDLGVFSSLRLSPLLDSGADPRIVPIAVTGQTAPVRMLRLATGVRLDNVRTDVHLLASWENRNFLGGLRRLLLEANPSLVFFGSSLPELRFPDRLLPQIDLRARFRQPGLLENRTAGLLWVDYDIRAVLARNAERSQTVLGYRQAQAGFGLDRTLGTGFYIRPSENLQIEKPFAYAGPLDPDLNRSLVLSYVEFLGNLDLRDDATRPRQGLYVSAQPQLAGPLGDARDLRLEQELRAYVPLSTRATLALRANVGTLFPFNYGEPDPDAPRRQRVRDAQLAYFRGFFSGGVNSNRGYPARGVGPHAVIEFFYPGGSVIAGECTADSTDERCKLPVGGLSLWELSTELRLDLSGPLSLTLFCDSSDVSPSLLDFRFDRPHLSCGPGLRYDTPLGPLRADLGVRLPGLQVLAERDGAEGNPPTLLGLPIAVALGIGEAF
jgi:outer membrane protein assembly factor BamA